jgi:hypothetical protein
MVEIRGRIYAQPRSVKLFTEKSQKLPPAQRCRFNEILSFLFEIFHQVVECGLHFAFALPYALRSLAQDDQNRVYDLLFEQQ